MSVRIFGYSEHKGSIGDQFRARRFKFFERCLALADKPVRILDVGGTESFWQNRGYKGKEGIHITILNLEKECIDNEHMQFIKGDATDLSRFEDDSFDIVFSNSVIEHLYTYDNQVKMASECQRVGIYHFIQTPNKYFFIEPHFRFPFFAQLPKGLAYWILTKTKLSLGQKWLPANAKATMDEIRLLDKREFIGLFKGSKLYTERLLFLRKSFTLHNFRLN